MATLASKRGAVWSGNIGSIALRLIQNILIARLAGPDKMGIFVAVAAYAQVFSRMTDLGLPNALVYFMRVSPSVSRRCLVICLAHAAFVFAGTLVLFWAVPAAGLATVLVSGNMSSAWVILALIVSAQFVNGVVGQMLIPLDAYQWYGATVTASPIVVIMLLIAYGTSIEVQTLITSLLWGESIAAIIAVGSLWRVTRRAECHGSTLPATRIYGYAIKTFGGTLMKSIGQRADRIVLSFFVSPAALAAYALATGLRDTAMMPVNTHASLLRNSLIDAERGPGGHQHAVTVLRTDLVRWIVISTGIAGLLALCCPILVPLLYGNDFSASISLFMVISLSLPMLTVATLCWTGLLSSKKPGLVTAGLMLNGAFTLVALFIGASIGSIITAAWVLVGASAVMAALWSIVSLRRPGATFSGPRGWAL